MKIVQRERIETFIEEYPDSQPSLDAWILVMERNRFSHLAQLRQTFGSADYVKPHTVFNIAGNKYRLITMINYVLSLVSIEDVLTHSEYDKGKWRK